MRLPQHEGHDPFFQRDRCRVPNSELNDCLRPPNETGLDLAIPTYPHAYPWDAAISMGDKRAICVEIQKDTRPWYRTACSQKYGKHISVSDT